MRSFIRALKHKIIGVGLCLIITVMIPSCSSERPETVAYFKDLTGLSICKTANLKNQKYGESDYRSDFTYLVKIYMNSDCKSKFYQEVLREFKTDCSEFKNCQFESQYVYYEIVNQGPYVEFLMKKT